MIIVRTFVMLVVIFIAVEVLGKVFIVVVMLLVVASCGSQSLCWLVVLWSWWR